MNPNPHTPPRWAEYLLELLIPLHRLEALQGDLYELFHKRLAEGGPRRARLLFARDVIHMLHPQLWRPEPGREAQAGSLGLLKHYLTVALRNLRRSRFCAALNATGLAVGLATSLLILLYVLHELSYDRYHCKADRTYRIVTRGRMEGSPMHFPVMGPSVARDLRHDLFSAVALFVLVIAGINFTNLATARAAQRAREVGVRKVLGSLREQLIAQFLLKSVLLAAFALLLGVGLTYLALPAFNRLTGQELQLLAHPRLLAALPGLGLVIGVSAGIYPAFVLSAFRPASVLKGTLQWTGGRLGVRNVLVVFQFGIAITLIVGTLVAYRQLAFLQQTRLGFDKVQTLVIHDTHQLGKNESVLKAQLERMAGVKKASVSGYVPLGDSRLSNDVFYPEHNRGQQFMFRLYGVDYDYLATMGMQLAQGRNFSPRFATDSGGILLNETAARALGWGDQAVGKKLYRLIMVLNRQPMYTVIGVVKDFHYESLHHKIAPLVMSLSGNWGSILLKLEAGDLSQVLASAEGLWKRMGPGAPFGYSFLDSRFESVYRAEQKTGELMGRFAWLTVFIACLGLFGLAAYTAERRRREIGIRKVLGATAGSILLLLSRDFLRLVLLANLVAWPLAWYASRRWLENFAYRNEMAPWFFAAAGGAALLIALVTVGFQALKATRTNPAVTLKND